MAVPQWDSFSPAQREASWPRLRHHSAHGHHSALWTEGLCCGGCAVSGWTRWDGVAGTPGTPGAPTWPTVTCCCALLCVALTCSADTAPYDDCAVVVRKPQPITRACKIAVKWPT